MSLIRIDGFDGYGTPANQSNFTNRMYSSGWNGDEFKMECSSNTRTGIGFSAATGMYGHAEVNFDAATGVIAGFAMNPGALGFKKICAFRYDNYAGTVNWPFILYQNPTGALSVFRGAGIFLFPGTLIAHSPVNSLFANTWHYVEIKWVNGGSTATFEIHVDGNNVLTFTDTAPNAPAVNIFGFLGQSPGGTTTFYDDFYLLRVDGVGYTDFLGDCVVHSMFPLSDAGPNQMNQFGGGVTHASAVNGLPADENSAYLYTNTAGHQELFTITDLPPDMIDILAMQVNVRAKKDSAGVAKYNISLKSGATLSQSPDKTPTTSFLEHQHIWEGNPAGGTWTKVTAQAAQIGFRVI